MIILHHRNNVGDFVYAAEIAWHERRRQWVGDQSQKSKRIPREPIMRYNI